MLVTEDQDTAVGEGLVEVTPLFVGRKGGQVDDVHPGAETRGQGGDGEARIAGLSLADGIGSGSGLAIDGGHGWLPMSSSGAPAGSCNHA